LKESRANELKAIKAELEKNRAIIEQAPTDAQLAKLQSDDASLEAKYKSALLKVKDAEADLERLKKDQGKDAAKLAPDFDPVAADKDIQQLTKDAEALTNRLSIARQQR